MTNPYGQYDSDGMPVSNGGGFDGQPYSGQAYPGQNYQNPQNAWNSQPFGAAPQQHPQMQPMQPGYAQPYGMMGPGVGQMSDKSKIAAALLAFFLGTLGVHNFYLGYTGRAITQLSLTIVGWITSLLLIGIFFIIGVSIWAFIEFILILVGSGSYAYDVSGRRLQ